MPRRRPIRLTVVPETVPTTAAPFHPSATHVDAERTQT